jgi:cytoskeletal protein CcmA (bactofilin family)
MTIFNRGDKSAEPAGTPKPITEEIVQKPIDTPRPQVPQQPVTPQIRTGASMASVISKALKITGQLESTEDIQIDGQIEGDVRGVGVKIGQNAKVVGTVYGDEVELAGTIEGKIEAKKVILTGTARMSGDVVHQDIKIESGAHVDGHLKPGMDKSDARPNLKPVASVSSLTADKPADAARH